MLREPPRVLQCRGRSLNPIHRDVVPQRMKNRVHVALDAGAQQLDDSCLAAQLGDVLFQRGPDESRTEASRSFNRLATSDTTWLTSAVLATRVFAIPRR